MNLSFRYSLFAPRFVSANTWELVKHDWYHIRSYCDTDLYACLAVWAKASWRAYSILGVSTWLEQTWRLWRGQLPSVATWIFVQQAVMCGFIPHARPRMPNSAVSTFFTVPLIRKATKAARRIDHAAAQRVRFDAEFDTNNDRSARNVEFFLDLGAFSSRLRPVQRAWPAATLTDTCGRRAGDGAASVGGRNAQFKAT